MHEELIDNGHVDNASVEVVKTLHVVNRREWRAWLAGNHSSEKEVWLVFYKKNTGRLRIPYEDAVEEALCFGWIDSIVKRIDDGKYVRKFTPRRQKSLWSEANRRRALKMTREGRMTDAGMAKVREAKENGTWRSATPRREVAPMPREFKNALEANKKARDNFARLATSYKKQYIGWIMSAKRGDTRKRRISETIRLLLENKKLPMK